MTSIPCVCDPKGHLPRIDRDKARAFQGDLKTLAPAQYDRLKQAMLDKGFIAPLFLWAGRDHILDGHQRLAVLVGEDWQVDGGIPCVEIQAKNKKDAAEKLLLLSSTYGKIDAQGLFDFTEEHEIDLPVWDLPDLPDFDLELYGDTFYPDNGKSDQDPDAVPEVEEAAITQPGDLWILGRHRVLCGDCTDKDNVERLMDGEVPRIMVTDPPYGVEYDPAWRQEAAEAGLLQYAAQRIGEVANDDRVDWTDAWRLFPGDVFYCWHDARRASNTQETIEAAGFEIRSQVIWNKPHFPISRGHYHWRHEPCWYAVRSGAQAHWIGDRKQTTIWDVALDENVEGGHSTQKPVECMEIPLRNHDGDVYDPFLGTGTTVIAAENQKRQCAGLEIAPQYVDVTIKRWQGYTHQEATLDGDGRTFAEITQERGEVCTS